MFYDTLRHRTVFFLVIGCHPLDQLAPVDNRNYMVFYTLNNLLDRIIPGYRSRQRAVSMTNGSDRVPAVRNITSEKNTANQVQNKEVYESINISILRPQIEQQ